ncbi:tenascin-N-like [Styela clava]
MVSTFCGTFMEIEILAQYIYDLIPPQNLRLQEVGEDYIIVRFDIAPSYFDGITFQLASKVFPDSIIDGTTVKVVDGKYNPLVRFSNLEPGTEYLITGFSYVEGYESEPVTLEVQTEQPPPRPTNVRVDDLATTSFTVRWDEHEDVDLYSCEVFFEPQPGVIGTRGRVYRNTALESPEVILTELTPGARYTIVVANIVGRRTSETVELSERTYPLQLKSFEQTGEGFDFVRLQFLPGEGVVDDFTFTIARADNIETILESTRVDIINGRVNNVVTFNDLSPNTQYVVSGYSTSGNKNSAVTNIMAKTRGELASPSNLRIEDVTTNSFTVKWDQADNVDFYFAEIFLLGEDSSQRVFFTNASKVPEIKSPPLTPGGRYRIDVANIGGGRMSDKMGIEETTTPMPIQNLRILNLNTNSATITFDVLPGIVDSFDIRIALKEVPDLPFEFKEVKVENGRVNALVRFSDLEPGREYEVTGIAKSGESESRPAKIQFSTDISTPAPINVRVDDVETTSFTVRWNEQDDVDFYSCVVFLLPPPGSLGAPAPIYSNSQLSSPEAIITGLTPGARYGIEVANIVGDKTSGMVDLEQRTTERKVDESNLLYAEPRAPRCPRCIDLMVDVQGKHVVTISTMLTFFVQ